MCSRFGENLMEVSRDLGSCGFTYARKAVSGSILALRRRPEVHTILWEYKPEVSRGVSRDWGLLGPMVVSLAGEADAREYSTQSFLIGS